jgi:hypothetical protein
MPEVPDKLLVFLFILLRDHLTAGEVAEILMRHVAKLDTDPGVDFNCPHVPWLPDAARILATQLLEPRTFFTIDGIEDDKYPPWHPQTIKYFDRASAEDFLGLMKNMCPDDEGYKNAAVVEHPVSLLEVLQPACTLPPDGWRCTRGAGHDGPCAAVPVGSEGAAPIPFERHKE